MSRATLGFCLMLAFATVLWIFIVITWKGRS
jgi:hypothetical protein